MPRGADFADGTVQSDNPIEVGETQAHGAGGNVDPNEPPARASKTAGLPEGLSEMQDYTASGGGSRGNLVGSGKGGHEPKSDGSQKGLGAYQDVETVSEGKSSEQQRKEKPEEDEE